MPLNAHGLMVPTGEQDGGKPTHRELKRHLVLLLIKCPLTPRPLFNGQSKLLSWGSEQVASEGAGFEP